MAAYKDKVKQDLDRWIEAGLVSADNRGAILDSLPEARRLDAATALAWIGGVLLGVAAISFIAANWDALSRLARFTLVLSAFALAAGAGAWAAHKQRPVLSDIALTLSALLFAAAIGLTGQIFDIAGDLRNALLMAAFAAVALALAGRSIGAAIAAVFFFTGVDFFEFDFLEHQGAAPWLLLGAPFGIALALRWRSAALAHAGALGAFLALVWIAGRYDEEGPLFLLFAVISAGAAFGARWLAKQEHAHGSVFYGWAVFAALLFFVIAGYANDTMRHGAGIGVIHRLAWLGASGALVALGRFDRHAFVTGIGVISLIIAAGALMADLGVELMTAALVFLLCAVAALIGGLMLRGKNKKKPA